VHLDLASAYGEAAAPISEAALFRAEAVLALLAALVLIRSARRLTFLAGLAVSASALTLMLVSRYADLGSFGPFPDLYDPVWLRRSCGWPSAKPSPAWRPWPGSCSSASGPA
jgi:hypothetical protein